MSKIEFNTEELANEYDNESPETIIKLALENFDNIAISFSGAEDVILVDIAKKIKKDVKDVPYFTTEKDIFDFLEMEYIEPHLRD